MLFEFLSQNKNEIIQVCKNKVIAAAESKPTSKLLDQGLPIFYDEVIEVLRRTASIAASENKTYVANKITEGDAAAHGKESLRLGYSISQVVHAYGAVCQSITEFAQTKSYEITTSEFKVFNLCLDLAIAEAVTEFDQVQRNTAARNETERLGFLIHELGNSLTAATIAHAMIQKGQVGSGGNTSKMLGLAHERMRHLIDRSLEEIRLQEYTVERTYLRLLDIINEVETSALVAAKLRWISLEIEVDPATHLTADHYLLFFALSNIVNNAIRFTKKEGRVLVRGKESGDRILIEVEDECGGLPEGSADDLFKSFIQKENDKTGMGLGISLSRKAIELNQGKLSVRNISGKGCVFTIHLPKSKL